MIVGELRGEKVDIVEWKEDPAEFVANAISPAKVKEVVVDSLKMTAEVVVPDNQLSLAIGKEGQNARLAAKLTGWRIDILNESQAMEAAAIRAEQLEQEAASQEGRQCRAITSSGARCRNKAKPGSDFCGMAAHQKLGQMIEAGEAEVEEVTPVEKAVEETTEESETVSEEEQTPTAGEEQPTSAEGANEAEILEAVGDSDQLDQAEGQTEEQGG
jgi:N utilization substance protein A